MRHRCSNFAAFLILVVPAWASPALARPDVLPKGVGAFQLGMRTYVNQSSSYNAQGQLVPNGEPLSNNFNGKSLLEGKGGDDLKKLAEYLQKYDSYSPAEDSLINQLNFGQMRGDVSGKIQGQFVGGAYGITNKFALFLGVPFISAEVNTKITFTGSNNAPNIKERLGEAAFDELQSGLDKAAAINAEQVIQSIESNGYQPIQKWKHSGMGDMLTGSTYGDYFKLSRSSTLDYVWQSTLYIPTGYVERPDILTDVSTGKGYYGWQNKLTPIYNYRNFVELGGWGLVQYNLPTSVDKRVPLENEALVEAERTRSVSLTPGMDFELGTTAGLRGDWMRASYRFAQMFHSEDRYSDGGIEGNYSALGAKSESSQLYHEATIGLDTTKAFAKKAAWIPVIVTLTAHQALQAKNTLDDRYFELGLIGFFKAGR